MPYWLTSTEEAANTTFLRMLRRLPRLLRSAWSLAWQASRRTTIAVLTFQLAAGVASAVGLISVVGVFDGLLREGPTPERVRAAAILPRPRRPAQTVPAIGRASCRERVCWIV